MKLSPKDLQALSDTAITAAKEAGAMIQKYAGTDFQVHGKGAGSTPSSQIVTEVDFKSQEIILKHISPTLDKFDLGLLTEELEDDGSRLEKEFFWCIDPLDGTLPFVENRPGYAVSIALVSNSGEAIIGVVYDPITRTLYHAIKDQGALKNNQAWGWECNPCEEPKLIIEGGGVMNCIWAIEQAPAFYLKQPKPEDGCGCLWDYAATACIYHELGAQATDSFGEPLNFNATETVFFNRVGVLFKSSCCAD